MRLVTKRNKKAGLPPGTPVYTGAQRDAAIRMEVARYDENDCLHEVDASWETVEKRLAEPGVKWLNVVGIHDVERVETIGRRLDIHTLVLEDVVNPSQRPKFEEYDGLIYFVARMITYDEVHNDLAAEQVSFILGDGWLVLFQEREGDVFSSIRQRLEAGTGRVRRQGADYLLYALLDEIVDHYFAVVEKLGDRMEVLEERVMTEPTPVLLREINGLRKELMLIRKAIWPLREAVSALQRTDSPLVDEGTRVFIRDVYDHVVQVMDALESCRDVISGLHDLYMSAVGNRMNEVMKVLTIIATIFIPLTFIAGVYGMNFEHMPELSLAWAYPASLGVMAVVAAGMVYYFRRKQWI